MFPFAHFYSRPVLQPVLSHIPPAKVKKPNPFLDREARRQLVCGSPNDKDVLHTHLYTGTILKPNNNAFWILACCTFDESVKVVVGLAL